MKNKNYTNRLGILLLIVLCGILPVGLVAHAESSTYETLEVKLPYKHIYTTTDVSADSVFHYSISSKDDAPLPIEAAANGVFSFNGVSGSGTEDGDKNVFNLDGNLTFKFTKPGIYYYEVKADSETDGKKKNASYYTLNSEAITITFYIVNAPEKNKINMGMMTAQVDDDIKLSEIVFETKYIEPEKTTVNSENSSASTPSSDTSSVKPNSENSVVSKSDSTISSTVSSKSADTTNSITAAQSAFGKTLKTGDESNHLFYVFLMTLSAVIFFLIPVLSDKEAEDG